MDLPLAAGLAAAALAGAACAYAAGAKRARALSQKAATLARELTLARDAANQEARLRELSDPLWTPQRLREHVRLRLAGRPLVVVSNREPYRHEKKGRGVRVTTPASGLVTGLEPLLRACGGVWVAHGDGDADFAAADARGRLLVPPSDPQYALRRVKLSAAQVAGHYEGWSNEGLWPLCHLAHVRPLFREQDWARYREVNAVFADAVLEEIEGVDEPFVLVQDYHFALLPAMIKERRPDARVALFWHIPWPTAEALGICPRHKELLAGMLGADVVGFHTQAHCNNFLDSADRYLEVRVDRERFAVKKGSRATVVKPFPISVAFPPLLPGDPQEEAAAARREVLAAAKISPRFVAVGVDRLDYTKGILERLRAVERLLETRPALRGAFTLLQIGAPSRTALAGYREFAAQVEAETARVNARFPGGAPPVVLLGQRTQDEIRRYYLAADACLVTSLHDGMNLVAKEFVAAREDERGVLVLSRFAGASRELRDALIVNPYSADEVADALAAALSMTPDAQALRMARLRRQVREHNVYRWAADLTGELAAVRLPAGVS